VACACTAEASVCSLGFWARGQAMAVPRGWCMSRVVANSAVAGHGQPSVDGVGSVAEDPEARGKKPNRLANNIASTTCGNVNVFRASPLSNVELTGIMSLHLVVLLGGHMR
jgi:hypothetical protein